MVVKRLGVVMPLENIEHRNKNTIIFKQTDRNSGPSSVTESFGPRPQVLVL